MENVAEQTELEYPQSWIFDDDGDLIEGRFLRFEEGRTKEYGPKVILILDVGGAERGLWLTQTVLFNRMRDELESRANKRLEPGERIVVKRLEKKYGAGDREYWRFSTLFPDRPEKTTSELFGLDEGPVAYEETKEPGSAQLGADDDLPEGF